MRLILILTTALIIIDARAAPQFNLSLGNWRLSGLRGHDRNRNNHESYIRNNRRGNQDPPQNDQPDYQDNQRSQENVQGLWGMCWYPLNNAARDLSNRGPPSHQYQNNNGMHYQTHHNVDNHRHDSFENSGHRGPPPRGHDPHQHNHRHPPPHHPPPHHHHHHQHHHDDHHNHYPAPPPPRPLHRPHKEMEYKLELCQEPYYETSTNGGSPSPDVVVINPSTYAPLSSSSTLDKLISVSTEETVTKNSIVDQGKVTSTTEFDWNNYFVDGTPENTDGVGIIDIRSGGASASATMSN